MYVEDLASPYLGLCSPLDKVPVFVTERPCLRFMSWPAVSAQQDTKATQRVPGQLPACPGLAEVREPMQPNT